MMDYGRRELGICTASLLKFFFHCLMSELFDKLNLALWCNPPVLEHSLHHKKIDIKVKNYYYVKNTKRKKT